MPKNTRKTTKQRSVTQAGDGISHVSAKRLFYTSLVLFVVAALLLLAALAVQRQVWNEKQGPSPSAGFAAGTPVSHGLVELEVKNVTSAGSQPGFVAPPGKHYLIVTLWVKNKSDQPINIFPSTDTYVKSASGKVSYLTPYGLTSPFRSGAVLPGESVEGQLSFLTSSSDALKFYVDAIWSGGVVSFAVQE